MWGEDFKLNREGGGTMWMLNSALFMFSTQNAFIVAIFLPMSITIPQIKSCQGKWRETTSAGKDEWDMC